MSKSFIKLFEARFYILGLSLNQLTHSIMVGPSSFTISTISSIPFAYDTYNHRFLLTVGNLNIDLFFLSRNLRFVKAEQEHLHTLLVVYPLYVSAIF